MTPLMRDFLRKIGEPMQIAQVAGADLAGAVPVFPCLGGFAAVLSPALLRGPDQVAKFGEIESCVRVVFNETNFEIVEEMSDENVAVLIVKPSINGLYFVWQAKAIPGIVSPFGAKQVLSAKALAFNIAMIIELTATGRGIPSAEQARRGIIAELCQQPVVKELAPTATGEFTT
jgi:hypothetical protein